jgi:ATP phosphoribosyltransferase regulatory subunit
MTGSLSKIPNGFRYYAADEARARRTIEQVAMEVFAGWSYEEIVPPTVDYYSLFELGMGQTEAECSFRFTDVDGRALALRPDVTSSVARASATLMANRPRPLRLCYCSTVFHQQTQSRADWRRESKQIGGELLGRNSTAADLEILIVAIEVLQRLALRRNYVITINDVEIFNGIVENLGLNSDAKDQLHGLVDVRAVGDLEGFLSDYTTADESAAFAELIQMSGKSEILERARQVITNPRSCEGLDRIETLWRVIESLGLSEHFEIDLGDVSRLDYYTGLTFKIYLEGVGRRIGGGGRYDKLTANFGRGEPAVGFVLELESLAEFVAQQNSENEAVDCPAPSAASKPSLDLISTFREAIELRARAEKVLIDCEVPACLN